MRPGGAALALALVLLAGAPASAAAPTPSPNALPIRGVTVEVVPMQPAPGIPANAPPADRVEQPPGALPFFSVPLGGSGMTPVRGFAAPKRIKKPSPSPSPRP